MFLKDILPYLVGYEIHFVYKKIFIIRFCFFPQWMEPFIERQEKTTFWLSAELSADVKLETQRYLVDTNYPPSVSFGLDY